MQVEREMPDREAIAEVFRELGLEDPDVQEHFRQLAKPSDWYTWRKSRYEPQDTRNDTVKEKGASHAQLESTP